MGLNWSDILYPGNPQRRKEVNKLAQSIRTNVDEIFGNVRTLSISLHKASNKFQVLDRLDLSITYEANFAKLQSVLAQWEQTTRELEMDPSIPQQIKDLMHKFESATSVGKFPDTVKDIVSDPSLAGLLSSGAVSLIVGWVVTYFSKKFLSTIINSTVRAVAAAGLLGTVVGSVIGVVVDIIIGAIEGAKERDTLEHLMRDYKALDQSLQDNLQVLEEDVADVVTAIIKAT